LIARLPRWDFVTDPPTKLLANLETARLHLRRGQYRSAKAAARRLLWTFQAGTAMGPTSKTMAWHLAEIRACAIHGNRPWYRALYAELEQFEAALRYFALVESLVPGHALAALGRCQTLAALGRISEALSAITACTGSNRSLLGGHAIRAITLVKAERSAKAEQTNIDPNLALARTELGDLLR
jgi:tetratricopeptide (TPR) repeat protein